MQDQTVLITGATNGIGKAIADALAATGAEIIIVSRNEARCAATADALRRATGNPRIRYYAADLSSQAQVRDLSSALNNDLARLDVLVNNVGAWFTDRKESVDGIEMTWALNHLNVFLLTHGLLDLIQRTAADHGQARIINQSSTAHYEGEIHWDNLEYVGNWDDEANGTGLRTGWGAYSQSKLANVLHAFALARRLAGSGVVANAVHPGTVVTGFAANNGLMYKLAAPVRRLFNRATPAEGAAPAVYLAAAPAAATISGAFYGPPQQREEPNPVANDSAAQDRLWEISLAQVDAVPA